MDSTNLTPLSELLRILRFDRLVAVLVGFAVIIFVAKSVQRISFKAQKNYPSKRVLFLQIATVLNFSLYMGGGAILVYAVLQPPKEILFAAAGSAAVAIGISLKDIVASVVAGVVLLFDRPFQVGDRVLFAGNYGEIVGIGLRTVKLNTLEDNLVTIPNARFLTDVVSSSNAGAIDMMVANDFTVAFNTDLTLARQLVREVVATSRFTYRKKPIVVTMSEVLLVDRVAIRLRINAYVIDCRFEKAFETDIVERVMHHFNKYGIARPTSLPLLSGAIPDSGTAV